MPGAAHVVTEYKDLLARTETLIREFQLSLSAGTVITTELSCRTELLRTGVRRGFATTPSRRRSQDRVQPSQRAPPAARPGGSACPA